jgi:hypothetical protein
LVHSSPWCVFLLGSQVGVARISQGCTVHKCEEVANQRGRNREREREFEREREKKKLSSSILTRRNSKCKGPEEHTRLALLHL